MENRRAKDSYVAFNIASLVTGAAAIILASCSNETIPVPIGAMPSPTRAFPRQVSSNGEELANGSQLKISQFPRQVTSIVFPTGVVGVGQPLTVNAWTVTFEKVPPTTSPILRYTWYGAGIPAGVMINGLTCTNGISGEHDCSIGIDTTCFVQIPHVVFFRIDCPKTFVVQ